MAFTVSSFPTTFHFPLRSTSSYVPAVEYLCSTVRQKWRNRNYDHFLSLPYRCGNRTVSDLPAPGNPCKLAVSLINVFQSHVTRYQLESKSFWQECITTQDTSFFLLCCTGFARQKSIKATRQTCSSSDSLAGVGVKS